MDQEETDDLTQRIISGDIDARDLDELVALLVSPETSAVMHTELLTGGMDPVWILAIDLYAEQMVERSADRLGDDDYALGYFQGMMAALNVAMRSAFLLGDKGEKAYDAMEYTVNVISSRFAKARNDAWPSELEESGDYEH
jgi:hypothetical protein